MTKKSITRTGISLEPELLSKLDQWISEKKFPNRSEAIRFLIREKLDTDILTVDLDSVVVGSLTFMYEHHGFDCTLKLTEIQHKYENLIISNMHAHITHSLCLETIFLKGIHSKVKELAENILALKGVLKGQLYLIPADE